MSVTSEENGHYVDLVNNFFEKLYFSFSPPLCVFCYKFLGGKQVSLYLLQHDKSISHGADTGLV